MIAEAGGFLAVLAGALLTYHTRRNTVRVVLNNIVGGGFVVKVNDLWMTDVNLVKEPELAAVYPTMGEALDDLQQCLRSKRVPASHRMVIRVK